MSKLVNLYNKLSLFFIKRHIYFIEDKMQEFRGHLSFVSNKGREYVVSGFNDFSNRHNMLLPKRRELEDKLKNAS